MKEDLRPVVKDEMKTNWSSNMSSSAVPSQTPPEGG